MTESQFYGVSDATLSPLPGNHSYRLEEDTTQEYLGMDVTSNTSNVTVSRYGIYGELEQYGVFWAAFYLHKYYLWVIFAFGFPGNIVSFITILRMKPLSSPIIYVAAVAFVDNSCLLCKILFYSFTRYDVHLTDGGCRTLFFLGSFTAQLANWLLVIMTVERCLAICLPLKVGSICTKKLHIGGVAFTVTVLLAINVHLFFTTGMVVSQHGHVTCETLGHEHFLKAWFWVDAIFYSFLPAVLLIIMNTLIILGIRRSSKIQRELTNKTSQVAETMRQQRQITIMLVIVCIAFVLLVTPNALFYAYRAHWEYERKSLGEALYKFTNQICFVLSDSTHAVNFYLYFFSTSRFRRRCLETVFSCCMSKKRARRFRGSTISGMSKTFRLSITDVTTVPANAVQLTNFSSSSSSSNHLLVGNGASRITKFRGGHRDGSF
ncbi:green-sensitive opsin [Biomphalaria glabrata]|nr:green-sensitive opsin [Biomphalaria glabrata]